MRPIAAETWEEQLRQATELLTKIMARLDKAQLLRLRDRVNRAIFDKEMEQRDEQRPPDA